MSECPGHKDGKTHRDPEWPVGRYAPGNYISKCSHCGEFFANMDKRAASCFPCAVEELGRYVGSVKAENEKLRQQVSDLKGAVSAAYCDESSVDKSEAWDAIAEKNERIATLQSQCARMKETVEFSFNTLKRFCDLAHARELDATPREFRRHIDAAELQILAEFPDEAKSNDKA